MRTVIEAVRDIRFGAVELVIHDGRVVQIERREKVRFEEGSNRRPDSRGRDHQSEHRVDRASGSSEARDAKEKR